MKIRFIVLFLLSALPAMVNAQLKVFMTSYNFLSVAENKTYVETALSIPAAGVHFSRNADGLFSDQLNITLQYYANDTQLQSTDQYVLQLPEIKDTTGLRYNFNDLRRVWLQTGNYTFKLSASDVNAPTSTDRVAQGFAVNNSDGVFLSSIQLVESFHQTTSKNVYSKNGYDVHPLAVPYYPSTSDTLVFYAEAYHASTAVTSGQVVISYNIETETGAPVQDLAGFSKQQAAALNVLFARFNISDLPTGNYDLHVQVFGASHQLLCERKLSFLRISGHGVSDYNNLALVNTANTFVAGMQLDSLRFYLKCLFPTASNNEKDFITDLAKGRDTVAMRRFFYNFWKDRNASAPQQEWLAYLAKVKEVDAQYQTSTRYGFETDRGRVYLQYGAPNYINGSDREPGAYPYEIWHYYKLNEKQSNVHFVFCNSDLVSNDYALIQSDAIGEVNDPRWRYKIYYTFKELNGYNDLDNTAMPNSFGMQVDQYYNQ